MGVGSNYRVNFEVRATTQGFDAGMNRINRGLTNISGGFRRSGVDAGFMANQLKAIGTTARYYLAGSLIYGVRSAVHNLGEFKTQLGEIDALATRISANGKITDISGQLNQLGKDALLMSNDFGASVGEVETYMQRFQTAMGARLTKMSTSQQRAQITEFVRSHLNLVTVLGSRAGDPNDLAGGLASMIKRMPGGDRRAGQNAQTLSNYLAYIVTNSPQLKGQDIANAAGRLASAQFLSGMSSLDVLGIYGKAAQTGGSPSVITRGITQLLGASLMHPTKPESKAIYNQAGLPTDPNALARVGGFNVFTRLMDYIEKSPSPGNKVNLDALYAVFSRQESTRQFANMLAADGVDGLKEFIKGLKEANKANYADVAAKNRLRYSTLVRASNAMTNLGISIVNGANGPLELAGNAVIGASDFAAKHQDITQAAVDTSLGLYAANKLRKLGAFSGLGRGVSRLGKFGRVGRLFGGLGKFLDVAGSAQSAAASQAIMAQEYPAVLAGGKADGSRGNPYWVIISPFSWQFGNPFQSPVPGPNTPSVPGGKKLIDKVKGFFKNPAVEGGEGAAAAGGVARGAAAVGLGTAAGLTATGVAVLSLGGDQGKLGGIVGTAKWGPHKGKQILNSDGYLYIMNEASHRLDARDVAAWIKPKTALQREIEAQQRNGGPLGPLGPVGGGGLDQVTRDLERQAAQKVMVHVDGVAKMILDLTTFDAQGGKVHVKKGVSAKLIPTRTHPTSQGKPGSRRGK